MRANDQLILHYFIRGQKKLKCYLLVKLLRNDQAIDIAYLEVPEEPCDFVLWMGEETDSVMVVKARLNMLNNRDKTDD